MDITSANVNWYKAMSLINFHLSRHRVITTMQPHQQHHPFFAGPLFKLGIFSVDPGEPPSASSDYYPAPKTSPYPARFMKTSRVASASLALFEPCLSHADQACLLLSRGR